MLFQPLCSALPAGVLSFASPKESSQRKGDPWVGAGCAGSLRYSPLAGYCGTRGYAPQTVLAPYPPTPALLGTFQGDGKARPEFTSAVNPKNRRKSGGVECRLGDAEQRRRAGGFRLASVRAAGEFSQPRPERCDASRGCTLGVPGLPSSAGNPAQRGVDSAVAFFLATFSWRSKKKYARRLGGTQRQ